MGGAVVGVVPECETRVSTLHKSIQTGRYLNADDDNAIVMGLALARNLKLTVGDSVTVLGAAADGSVAADSLQLVGIFHSRLDDIDRQVTQIPLSRFQDTFVLPNQANTIALSGDNLARVNSALPAIGRLAAKQDLVALDWSQLEPGLKQAIDLDFSTALLRYASLVRIFIPAFPNMVDCLSLLMPCARTAPKVLSVLNCGITFD